MAKTQFLGWTIAEAIERTSDPAHWSALLSARADLDALGEEGRASIRSEFVEGDEARAYNRQQSRQTAVFREKKRAVAECCQVIEAAFFEHATTSRLIAVGARGGPTSEPFIVRPESYEALRVGQWDRSELFEATPERTRISGVRIFPLAHAPNAVSHITGLSLGEAFRKCVLEDPEVVVVAKRMTERFPKAADVFRDGSSPGFERDYGWPLDLCPDHFAFQLVRGRLMWLEDQPFQVPDIALDVARVLADRLQGLRNLLMSGEAVARGTNEISGTLDIIDPLQWSRKGWAVEVQDSDLFDLNTKFLTRRWTGLTLLAANSVASVFLGKPTALAEIRSATTEQQLVTLSPPAATPRSTPVPPDITHRKMGGKSEEVLSAARQAGIDLSTSKRGSTELAGQIGRHLTQPPQTQNEVEALRKLIDRLRSSLDPNKSSA